MTLFSQVGSRDHANHTHSQGSARAKKMSAIYGRKCLDAFGRFARNGLWAKTFSELLIGTGDWYSTRCRLIWRLKATKSRRMYFQLVPKTLPTEGTGFGLLPTTRARDGVKGSDREMTFKDGKWQNLDKNGTPYGMTLEQAVRLLPTTQAIDGTGNGRDLRLKKDSNRDPDQPGSLRGDLKDYASQGLLPTPTTGADRNTDFAQGGKCLKTGLMESGLLPTPRKQSANSPSVHGEGGMELQLAVLNLLPTPAAQNYKGASSAEALEARGRLKPKADDLANQFAQPGISSQLNPLFVLEMMGFPTDYLDPMFGIILEEICEKKKSSKSYGRREADLQKQQSWPAETQ